MSKRIERYEGRSGPDLNAKNLCAFCGNSLGNGNLQIYSNKRGELFDRASCRTKHNESESEREFNERYADIASKPGFFV